MDFRSILFLNDDESAEVPEPLYFRDLNLDQIVDAIAAREKEFDLRPLFYRSLSTADAIAYRQEAMHELQCEEVLSLVRSFCGSMQTMREQLVQREKLDYNKQRFRWLLHAVETYCSAVLKLAADLSHAYIGSRAFVAFRLFLKGYAESVAFRTLLASSQRIASGLTGVRYCILVGRGLVTVRSYESQPDYSEQIAATFEKFRRGSVNDYRTTFREHPHMNHVEEHILGFVAKLYPEVFGALRTFAEENEGFRDPVVMRFDAEVRFYVAYLEHVSSFQEAGLVFCYPELAVADKHVRASDTFDLALARNLAAQNAPVVCNDFALNGSERVFSVSGPNQGGKTTFARTFGQLHHLASLGVQVPGSCARLYIFDRILTHFEREESIDTLRGKLQDDLVRIHDILEMATTRSIIIVNEIFSSTTLSDAVFLATKTIERIVTLDALCVCVTFMVDLAKLSGTIVSLVSEVVPEHPEVRTFKVLRAAADGKSYAQSIAEKYGLTYDLLKERIEP